MALSSDDATLGATGGDAPPINDCFGGFGMELLDTEKDERYISRDEFESRLAQLHETEQLRAVSLVPGGCPAGDAQHGTVPVHWIRYAPRAPNTDAADGSPALLERIAALEALVHELHRHGPAKPPAPLPIALEAAAPGADAAESNEAVAKQEKLAAATPKEEEALVVAAKAAPPEEGGGDADKSHSDLDQEEQQTLAETMLDELNETYYGRVQIGVLFIALNCALGEPPSWGALLEMGGKLCGVLCVIFLQLVAFVSIMDEQVLLAGLSDDRFATGDDSPHNFRYAYAYGLLDLPMPVLGIVLFSVIMVTFSVLRELRSIMIGYLVLTDIADELAGASESESLPAAILSRRFSSSKSIVALCVWALAHGVHMLRVGLLVQFVVSSSFLIGCSDGPAEILLNSVAALFILDADDLLAECFTPPWKDRHDEARVARARRLVFIETHLERITTRCIKQHWAHWLNLANGVYAAAVGVVLLWQSVLLQQATSGGSNGITHVLSEVSFTSLCIIPPLLLGDVIMVYVSHARKPWPALLCTLLGSFVYEFIFATFIVHMALIKGGISYGTLNWNSKVTVQADGF